MPPRPDGPNDPHNNDDTVDYGRADWITTNVIPSMALGPLSDSIRITGKFGISH